MRPLLRYGLDRKVRRVWEWLAALFLDPNHIVEDIDNLLFVALFALAIAFIILGVGLWQTH